MLEEPVEPGNNQEIRDEKGRFLPGVSGNPTGAGGGRPEGSISIKEQLKKRLAENPEELREIVEYFIKENRELMWVMLEGRPKQQMDIDLDKDSLAELTHFFRTIAKPTN